MNVQLANISFLVLLCSMICYWIGPLSRDLFVNYSLKDMVQKDKKQISSSEGDKNNMSSISPSCYVGMPENNVLDSIDLLKYQDSGKDITKKNSVISSGLNQSAISTELVAEAQNANYISPSGLQTKNSNASMLFSSNTNLSTLQKSYGFLEDLFKKIRSQMGYIKISLNISNGLEYMGRLGIILSNVLLMVLLCNRWKESGHFPLSNLYESLMFLSWSFTVIHLFLENLTNSQTSSNQSVSKFIGAITTPSALFTNAFATFTLPKEMQGSSSLVPALQSNWLMMHVTVMIISYAALILGSLLSIAYLIITVKRESNMDRKNLSIALDSTNIKHNETESTIQNKQNIRESVSLTLDNLSYRILGIGFPFLTIGILSGAVWANEAWGSYWSWDPKETWAFLTWLVYAIYLHTRLNKGWEGKKPAIIASIGFIVTWICYLGVNLIGEGLHSYGWIMK